MKSSLRAFAVLTFSILASMQVYSSTVCNGAGSTFVEPIFNKWFSEYSKKNPESTFNYQGIGSGGGIRQVIAGTVDFGASDAPMNADENKQAGKTIHHLPTVLGAVVVGYNLSLTSPLKLNGALVADIFSGKITKWDDAAIAKLNPGVSLPAKPIIVATRSDGSGTTAIFTDYLEKVSPNWKGKAGKTVDWFKGSMGAKGNAGVTGFIKQAEGAIGYIELAYAIENKVAYAQIQNKAGKFITPDMNSVSASISKKVMADLIKNDFKGSITDGDDVKAYPISGMTWILIPEKGVKEKSEPLMKMVDWILGDEAQKMAEILYFAPLPNEFRAKVKNKAKNIKL